MSGHSHWATIKHKKTSQDARKGKIYSKLARAVMVAAREGGSDPAHNLKLQEAVEKARQANMPKDNIERAVKKGAGELEGISFERITYEGYGPGGVAIMVDTLTDNRNRTTNEIRTIFERNNGTLAGANSVSWQFEKKGVLRVTDGQLNEDELLSIAAELGADNVEHMEDEYEISCPVENFYEIKKKIAEKYPVKSDEVTLAPKSYVQVNEHEGRRLLELMDALEDHDDVQNVYANCDLPNTLLAEKAK